MLNTYLCAWRYLLWSAQGVWNPYGQSLRSFCRSHAVAHSPPQAYPTNLSHLRSPIGQWWWRYPSVEGGKSVRPTPRHATPLPSSALLSLRSLSHSLTHTHRHTNTCVGWYVAKNEGLDARRKLMAPYDPAINFHKLYGSCQAAETSLHNRGYAFRKVLKLIHASRRKVPWVGFSRHVEVPCYLRIHTDRQWMMKTLHWNARLVHLSIFALHYFIFSGALSAILWKKKTKNKISKQNSKARQ